MIDAPSTDAQQRPSNSSGKILVVEDELAIRDLLRIHLQNAGYEAIVAADALDAGRLFLEMKDGIDLIIVDAQLPYMSGIEFASALIADTTLPAVPIILITGHERFVMRAAMLDLPCLVKPFSVVDLMSVVEKTLAGRAPVAVAGVRANAENRAAGRSESR
jgi:two-component system phosphate regulon response regulator PhoB